MVLILLSGFKGKSRHITNLSLSLRSPPLNSTEPTIRRKTEETTPVDDFKHFSETHPEPKAVENDINGLPGLHGLFILHVQASFVQLSLIVSLRGFVTALSKRLNY